MSLWDFLFLFELIGGFVKLFSAGVDCVSDSNVPSIFVLNFYLPGGTLRHKEINVCDLLAFVYL